MARVTKYTLRATHFDFRRARVRASYDSGKTWYIEDKSSICYILQHLDYYKYLYADVVYTYNEVKEKLLAELKEANYPNVVIITNDED